MICKQEDSLSEETIFVFTLKNYIVDVDHALVYDSFKSDLGVLEVVVNGQLLLVDVILHRLTVNGVVGCGQDLLHEGVTKALLVKYNTSHNLFKDLIAHCLRTCIHYLSNYIFDPFNSQYSL